MSKILSRLILGFTALSAVFFTSSAFADTPISTPYYGSKSTLTDDGNIVRTIQWISKSSTGQYAMNSAVWYGASLTNTKTNYSSPIVSYCPSFHNRVMTHRLDSSGVFYQDNVLGYISPGLVNLSSSGVITTEKWFAKHPTFYWTNDGFHDPYEATLSSTGTSAICSTTAYIYSKWEHLMGAGVSTHSSIKSGEYNSYLNKYCVDSTFCATLTDLVTSSSCSVDNIATGGNCSCKKTGGYTASSSGTALDYKIDGVSVTSSLSNRNYSDIFSGKFDRYQLYLPSGSWYKTDPLLAQISASDIGGARSIQLIGSSTGMLASDSRTLVSTVSGNSYTFFTTDGKASDYTNGALYSNYSSSSDNQFNAFVVNASTGNVLLTLLSRFSVYYQKGTGFDSSNVFNDYTYLGDFGVNTMIPLPYGQSTRRVKLVPLATTVYVSGISPFNVTYTPDQICTVLSGADLQAEIDSRNSYSGALMNSSLANFDLCAGMSTVGGGFCTAFKYLGDKLTGTISSLPVIGQTINLFKVVDFFVPMTPTYTFQAPTIKLNGADPWYISTQTGTVIPIASGAVATPFGLEKPADSRTLMIILALVVFWISNLFVLFLFVGFFFFNVLFIKKIHSVFLPEDHGSGNFFALVAWLLFFSAIVTVFFAIYALLIGLPDYIIIIKDYIVVLVSFILSYDPLAYVGFATISNLIAGSFWLSFTSYFIYVLITKFGKVN